MIQNNLQFDELSNEDNTIINDFLSLYKESSHPNYITAIKRMLSVLKIEALSEISYQDYINMRKYYETQDNSLKTQDRYRISFIKFLVATDVINDPKFNEIWLINNLKKQLKLKKEEHSVWEVKSDTLSFEDICSIKNFISQEKFSDNNFAKMAFAIYMIFEAGCEIDELRNNFDPNMYEDGIFISDYDKEYIIPTRFRFFFENNLLGYNNNFKSLDHLIRRAGEYLGISKLIPMNIKHARKRSMIACSNCKNMYINYAENWKVIDGQVICSDCSNKYNGNYSSATLAVIDVITNKFVVSENFLSKQQELNGKVDYLKLHELQIEIGKLAEEYVYEFELNKLKNSKYKDLVDKSKADNPENGYDILSYDAEGNQIFIEVKGTSKMWYDEFYITNHELESMKKLNVLPNQYYIYRVSKILGNTEDIELNIIEDFINNPDFMLQAEKWKVICKK